jgi:Ni,Fe-hydrogenase III small subunit
MKERKTNLKIFNFSHPIMNTEILSLIGNKYVHALPFDWQLTYDYDCADILLWDGLITLKNQSSVNRMVNDSKSSKVLLLIGESMTLLKKHPIIKILDTENLNYVELPGWNILPEEILSAIETCYKKLRNV